MPHDEARRGARADAHAVVRELASVAQAHDVTVRVDDVDGAEAYGGARTVRQRAREPCFDVERFQRARDGDDVGGLWEAGGV